jgi:hypothetical protein
MRRIAVSLFLVLLANVLTACGGEVDTIQQMEDEKAKAKTEQTVAEVEPESAAEPAEVEEDIWTYYEDAKWEGTWEGLNFTVQKVVVSDEAPMLNDDGEEVIGSAVGVKMRVENTSADKVYTTYPDQATLVTSTGEQVPADFWLSDNLGGEVHEGVVKEGDLIFYLERGEAESVEWVKLVWSSSYSDPDGKYENDLYHDQEVKLELK